MANEDTGIQKQMILVQNLMNQDQHYASLTSWFQSDNLNMLLILNNFVYFFYTFSSKTEVILN